MKITFTMQRKSTQKSSEILSYSFGSVGRGPWLSAHGFIRPSIKKHSNVARPKWRNLKFGSKWQDKND